MKKSATRGSRNIKHVKRYTIGSALYQTVSQYAKVQERVRYAGRSEEHTSELQSLMRISYAVFCLKKKKQNIYITIHTNEVIRSTQYNTKKNNQRSSRIRQ